MSHMVIFQTPDGSPGYNQFESVEEAVGFVEKLRNDQGIENARMFALEEIKFELKPYFKVELQALNPGAPSASPSAAAAAPTPAAAPAPAAQPAPSAPAAAETTSFGSPSPSPAPSASPSPAPAPSAEPAPAAAPPSSEASSGDSQPTRRGLFGR